MVTNHLLNAATLDPSDLVPGMCSPTSKSFCGKRYTACPADPAYYAKGGDWEQKVVEGSGRNRDESLHSSVSRGKMFFFQQKHFSHTTQFVAPRLLGGWFCQCSWFWSQLQGKFRSQGYLKGWSIGTINPRHHRTGTYWQVGRALLPS